ncbi:hypothetical protein PYW08_010205 [Mythimna loreyi]|uniref:Uncharacterized protein n=1 Tax=Mythimna loreyi TaxID=667449 RepID=A0ACC2Q6A3_9NEOP|nr:hypothetical protein PYW08_010205 [Mythimna loreyi]
MTMHQMFLRIAQNHMLLLLKSVPSHKFLFPESALNHQLLLVTRLLRLQEHRQMSVQLPKAYEDVIITPDILEDTPELDTLSEDEIEPEEEDDSTDEDDD